ncbi:MAG: hypothetical protein ABUT39_30005 [Acidobacteriota bacterium]
MARSGGGGLAFLALIVSLVALFFSWKAYERSGGRIGDVLDTEVEVGDESPPDWRAALDEARETLDKARENLEGDDVARVREKLARSFRNAGEGAKRGWRELDSDLERLQGQLEKGGSRAKETLDETLDKMRRIGS